jgi:type III secretion protein J
MLQRPLLIGLLAAAALLAGCKESLLAKVTEPQANEVLAALSEARIDASKERIDETTWEVKVDDAKIGQALVFLRNRGLPSQPSATMGEVFKKDGVLSSATEERARYTFALQEDIVGTLRRIEGVVDARVHLAIPHADPLATRVTPVSASVFIKYRPALDIDIMAPSIKSMVMSSVEGLDFRNITLVALPAMRDAAAEPPVQRNRGGVFTAQAAVLESPSPDSGPAQLSSVNSSGNSSAGGELLGAAVAGLCLMGVGGWGLRRTGALAWLRRRDGPGAAADAEDSGLNAATAEDAADPANAANVANVAKVAALQARALAHARANAPCPQPGLFAKSTPPQR